jgi:hypothetical protein
MKVYRRTYVLERTPVLLNRSCMDHKIFLEVLFKGNLFSFSGFEPESSSSSPRYPYSNTVHKKSCLFPYVFLKRGLTFLSIRNALSIALKIHGVKWKDIYE